MIIYYMLRLLISCSLLLVSINLAVQEIHELATDRPGLGSDAPIAVPKGYLQADDKNQSPITLALRSTWELNGKKVLPPPLTTTSFPWI